MRHALRRRRADALLAALSRPDGAPAVATVLVDGVWDNPNYWIRYAMFRAALNLGGAREIGFTGPWNAPRVRRTMRRLGISESIALMSLADRTAANRRLAGDLVASTQAPGDVLRWKLPHDVPADYVYDGILKRQRKGTVDLRDPQLVAYVTEALDCIDAAERLLERVPADLVAVSHQCNFLHTALVWLAIRRRIPVVMLWNAYGVLRFSRLLEESHLRDWSDVPTPAEVRRLPADREEKLVAIGREYLDRRLGGRTADAVAVRAYQRRQVRVDRALLARELGWDPSRPVIAVYAPNWFDFPHSSGLSFFRDYQEWLEATVEYARRDTRVGWLVKGHPWDDSYGGVKLRDVIPSLEGAPHIRIVPDDWNGRSVMDTADALITCQGTAGIEFASLGKPVLVSDAGWYHDAGFVQVPRTRDDYFAKLASEWWKDADGDTVARRAWLFSGLFFCHPRWQEGFELGEDLDQWKLYAALPGLLTQGEEAIHREKALMREWWASGTRGYHTYKMMTAESYRS